MAANRHCCHHSVPLAHQGYQLAEGPWRPFPMDLRKGWEQQMVLSCPLRVGKGVPASQQQH